MRDFPFFTTQSGISSLTLKEIPYRAEAYIRVLQLQPEGMEAHLAECAAFCRAAGAEHIYASGDEGLEGYPLHTAVVEMRGRAWVDQSKLESLFPVTQATAARWREVYNRAMKSVDNASTLESRDEKALLEKGGAYFVHRNGSLLGIGWLEDTRLLAVAAVEPGAGERVMHTLMSLVEDSAMVLEVASTNARAIRLYERLGFVKTGELTRWYRIK